MILKVSEDYFDAIKNFKQIILDELNIKEIEFATKEDEFNDYSLQLNFRKAGAVLKGEVNNLKQKLLQMDVQSMKDLVQKVQECKNVSIDGFGQLSYELFEIKIMPKKEFAIANLGNNLVVLDIELSDNLIAEGKLRELIREIQVARKEANFNIEDRICLNLSSSDSELNSIIEANLKTINSEVLCVSNDLVKDGYEKTLTIDGKDVVLKMKKN